MAKITKRKKKIFKDQKTKLIPKPSPRNINSCLEKWEHSKSLENYRLQESSLNLLFKKYCPRNKNINHVLLKVSALNDFYSTRILAIYKVAKHIKEANIDTKLSHNDFKIVNNIAKNRIKGQSKNFYSFASKYCHHHNPKNYPIYDYYVERMLMFYKKKYKDSFPKFVKADLKNYSKFIRIISKFKKYFQLSKFSLREIDLFLWLTGKNKFRRNYNTKKA